MSGVGHLGELSVMEYFKKSLKHQVYLPLKDSGIDFVSVGKRKFYQIQVKTSMFQKNSYFWFDLYDKKMVYSRETYYIFVCMNLGRRQFMSKSKNFIVVPSLLLKRWINQGKIAPKKDSPHVFNIFIYPDFKNREWAYRNKGKEIDLTPYWNNFNLFKQNTR